MFGSAGVPTRPAGYTGDGLTGRLWNTTSCVAAAPLTHPPRAWLMGACLGGLLSAWTRRTSASTCSTCTTPAVCACRRPRCYACSSPRWVGLLSVVGSSPSTPGVQVSGCSSTAGEQQSVATPQVNAMRENGHAHPADTPRTSLVVPFRAAFEWRLSKPEAAERSFTLPADEAGVSKCADVRRPVAAIGLRASGAPVSAHPPALPVRTRPPHSGAAGGPSHPRRYPTYAHPLDVANSVPIKSRAPRRPAQRRSKRCPHSRVGRFDTPYRPPHVLLGMSLRTFGDALTPPPP